MKAGFPNLERPKLNENILLAGSEKKLREKLAEYGIRKNDQSRSEKDRLDAGYKEFIVTELLVRGNLSATLAEKLVIKQPFQNFSMDAFREAWKVIADYCKTGGKDTNKKPLGEGKPFYNYDPQD